MYLYETVEASRYRKLSGKPCSHRIGLNENIYSKYTCVPNLPTFLHKIHYLYPHFGFLYTPKRKKKNTFVSGSGVVCFYFGKREGYSSASHSEIIIENPRAYLERKRFAIHSKYRPSPSIKQHCHLSPRIQRSCIVATHRKERVDVSTFEFTARGLSTQTCVCVCTRRIFPSFPAGVRRIIPGAIDEPSIIVIRRSGRVRRPHTRRRNTCIRTRQLIN